MYPIGHPFKLNIPSTCHPGREVVAVVGDVVALFQKVATGGMVSMLSLPKLIKKQAIGALRPQHAGMQKTESK